ncbi:MAG TPA: Tol-Pal system beta propeller repeat protein TolB [Steroidobacteraceae bacterium]|jgi:TolB protein|nr:Tol-Pal system beta propeller repeat protein TolB [Steroidobacteraceae bacterium]
MMRKLLTTITVLMLFVSLAPARAELKVDITKGVTDPIPVAIVQFARAVPADGGLDVAAVVQRDLESSGRFKGMDRKDMLSSPVRGSEVQIADWRTARNDYIVVGRVSSSSPTELVIDFELMNLLTGQSLLTQRVNVAPASLRFGAHRVADLVYEKITGTRGAFSTRIAYVSVDGQPPSQRYQLLVADADGENMRVVMQSNQPIMSPAWSPDGQWIAYVSFENRASAVFLQRVRTGERRQISARAGVNNAPSFSPDGRKIALTLSGSSGNLDIYVLDLATQGLTRITDDPAIDTEAVWSADGRSLYFTSDRAGGPQIYEVAAQAGQRPKRITFGTGYAAGPRLSPDGKLIALVTQESGSFRIAVHDLASGQMRTLSRGGLDESPSFAPNGAQLIFGGKDRGQGVLAMVSVDGQVTQRLKSDQGEVRDPVWGPFSN